MTNIMINTNMPIKKEAETLKMFIADTPILSTTKFAWDELRFTLEHHRINDWTLAVENVENNELVMYHENISTLLLGKILNTCLK